MQETTLEGHTSNIFQQEVEVKIGWHLFFKCKNYKEFIINKGWPLCLYLC